MSSFPTDEGSPEFSSSQSPELSLGPINFYFECKSEPWNEPEPGVELGIEPGIEPEPGVEPRIEPELRVEPELGLYLLSFSGI